VSLATVLAFGTMMASHQEAFASKLSDLKSQKKQIESKESEVEENIKEKDAQISHLQQEQQQLEAEIKRIDLAISDTTKKIHEKEVQIDETKAEIERLKQEIEILKNRINERNDLLKNRARSMQESGGLISYIDVLLGAESFSDFIDRVSAIATIMEADNQIIEQHKQDKADLEAKKAEVTNKLNELENMRAELETMKTQFETQKAEKDKLVKQLQKEEQQLEHQKMELEEEKEILAAQKSAVQKAIELEKKRLEELAKQQQQSSGSSGTSGTPPVTPGLFMRPSEGYVSSNFGHRWGSFHYGVDIAKSGTVPIVAAADGVVLRSYYSSSYGEVIFITHSINGKIYTTVYAHLSSRLVGTGAVVSKGQKIGYMGNTGHSFGQHLHFELHEGEWNASKSNAVDPRKYINF
jgi:peptidoglycan hydrolase CwlO-like protein